MGAINTILLLYCIYRLHLISNQPKPPIRVSAPFKPENEVSKLIKAKVGDRVKCKYGNSGNKFWYKFLDTNPVIEQIRFNKIAGFHEFKLAGNETWWHENDFIILKPETLRPNQVRGREVEDLRFEFDVKIKG